MGSADFFGWLLETVDVALGLDDGRLHCARGLNALSVAPHVALVSCYGIRQVGVDKMPVRPGMAASSLLCFRACISVGTGGGQRAW
jgi:hypothetical protein